MSARRALAALTLLAACDGGCAGWDFERMLQQPRYEPYGASAFFEDGRSMRPSPAGALAHSGRALARTAPAPRPSPALELLERGRERFDIYCAPCHGVDGYARTQIARMMRLRPPPALHEPHIRARGIDHVQRVIETGYGLMPAYAALLTADEEWAVALYVQALWISQNAPLDSLPGPLRERALRELARGSAGAP